MDITELRQYYERFDALVEQLLPESDVDSGRFYAIELNPDWISGTVILKYRERTSAVPSQDDPVHELTITDPDILSTARDLERFYDVFINER